MKRRNLSVKTRSHEKAAITQFVFEMCLPCDGSKTLYIGDVFQAYQDWRKRRDLAPTALSTDGFGRLFPKNFKRKQAYSPDLKHNQNSVFGLEIRA